MYESETLRCPATDTLDRFLGEELDEAFEERVQAHLDRCEACRAKLEAAAGSPAFWDELRDVEGLSEDLGGPSSTGASWPGAVDDAEALNELQGLLTPAEDPRFLGRLGSFEVSGWIGRGSTGIVLKAFDARLNRYVAIKLLSPSYRGHGPARRRFEREGRSVAAIAHENVVPVYAVDEHDGLPFIVMQYVGGPSLQQRVDRDGALDSCAAVRIGLQVAEALAAAHAQGIVHRDVKPANVLLEANVERAMVTDFGLARVTDDASATRSGTITGTPAFMSPEQARGEDIDGRSDLFSLGSLIYFACAGRPPFRAETLFGVLKRVAETEPRGLREVAPGTPAWLEAFVSRLMAKERGARFSSATEVAELLRAELAHLQNPTAVAEPERAWWPRPRASRFLSRRRLPLALAGAAALALGVFGASLLGSGDAERGDSGSSQTQAALFGQEQRASGEEGLQREEWERLEDREPGFTATGPGRFEAFTEQRFAFSSAQDLSIVMDLGDVVVEPGPGEEIVLRAWRTVRADDVEQAQGLLAGHELELVDDADESILRAVSVRGAGGAPGVRPLRARYHVTIPAGCAPSVTTGVGNLFLGSFGGDVRGRSTRGNVVLDRQLGNVWVRTDDGGIDLSAGCVGEAELVAVGGDVHVAGIGRFASVMSSGGPVRIGPSVGGVQAQTSGADIVVEDVRGPVAAFASGGDVIARVAASPDAELRLTAQHGDVDLELAPGVAAELLVRGVLESPFAFETTDDGPVPGDWQRCLTNGGGARIDVRSSTGVVRIAQLAEPVRAEGPVEENGGSGGLVRLAGEGSSAAAAGLPEDGATGQGSKGTAGGSSLGGSGLGGSGLGVSGLGGSGLGGSGAGSSSARGMLPEAVRQKLSGAPRPGALVTVEGDPDRLIDGYTLYLPVSFQVEEGPYPLIVYLSGGFSVGGAIGDINSWGLPRLLRDEFALDTERNQLLLDRFVVVSPHLVEGNYDDDVPAIEDILEEMITTYSVDPDRIYLTGLSRGGSGSWGLAQRMPGTFAAIAPIAGRVGELVDAPGMNELAVWIAHNSHDGITPFGPAERAALALEEASGRAFLRLEPHQLADGTPDGPLVFTSERSDSHDAWTDVYCSSAFYRWLLTHRRAR